MGKEDFEKAIAVFEVNVEAFPNSFNVYDSYGEALLKQGAREEAIKNYWKSIKLNPGNANGFKVLNELGISIEDLIGNIAVPINEQVLATYVGRYQTSARRNHDDPYGRRPAHCRTKRTTAEPDRRI